MTVFSHDSTPFRIFFTRTHRLQARFAKNSTATGVYSPSLRSPWRTAIEEILRLDFIKEAVNIILLGPNGVGKSMIAANLVYQNILRGQTGLFVTASRMLSDLSGQDGHQALNRRFKYYANPSLLYIDELGYLSYSTTHADLLFEIISRRYKKKSTIVTANKPFSEWDTIFPNPSCVVSIIDRLVHASEIVNIEGPSYRVKEAKEASAKRHQARGKNKTSIEETSNTEVSKAHLEHEKHQQWMQTNRPRRAPYPNSALNKP